MNRHSLHCDQAIYTSIRTPMGEGYRIIAAGPGIRADEKQVITRNSPSHEGLCDSSPTDTNGSWPISAASFYVLPSGRLCMALSCQAGAEHTGRGGQRVYTHSIVFDPDDFPNCGFNPFHVLRAMIAAQLHVPTLKPPPILEAIELQVITDYDNPTAPRLHHSLCNSLGCHILRGVFSDRSQIVQIESDWLSSTEALLFGLPGPLRMRASFAAGLRFSVGRRHVLHLLHDEKGAVKQRLAGQPVDYIDTAHPPELHESSSAWVSFVARRWKNDDYVKLARETSRAFTDTTPEACERIGSLYNDMDAIPDMSTDILLTRSQERLRNYGNDAEQNIATEFLVKSSRALVARFADTSWADIGSHWTKLAEAWRSDECQSPFIQPVLEAALRGAMRDDPLLAAERALMLTRNIPSTVDRSSQTAFLDEVLNRLADWVQSDPDSDPHRVLELCDHWVSIRRGCPILDRIRQRCTA